ncbi:hypothetical protein [Micromonospora aurantiaca (nom. illeg.)]|uniref:hypothetical protein n=1 Tax=Micromonospora aurantiaca (nom. illeg.) TaxID=47850 RepID=UPI00340D1F09
MSTPDRSYLLDHTSHVLRTRVAAALAETGDMDKTTMVVTVDELEGLAAGHLRPRTAERADAPVLVG